MESDISTHFRWGRATQKQLVARSTAQRTAAGPRQRPRQGFSAKESLGAVARRSRGDRAAPVPPPSPRLWPRPPVCPSGRGRSGTWSELCTARGHPLRTARRAARRAAHVELRDADVMEPRAGEGVAVRCEAGPPPRGFSADGLHGARGTHGLRERFHAAPHTPSAPSCASCRGRCSVSHAVSVNRRGVLLCSTTHQAPRAAIASPAQ